MGLRDRLAIIRALLHAISSPQPYTGQVKSSSGATHSRSEHPDPNLLFPSSLRGLCRIRRRSLSEAAYALLLKMRNKLSTSTLRSFPDGSLGFIGLSNHLDYIMFLFISSSVGYVSTDR